MRFQNQGLKTGSFAVTHGRTPIVCTCSRSAERTAKKDIGSQPGWVRSIQRRLAWPLRKDDTHKSRSVTMISGILAGGIPGFRMVLCCFTHSLVWPGGLVFLSFVVLPYHTEMIQGYHLLHQLTYFTHELEPVTLLICLCGLCFWFCVFVFLCFACFWCLVFVSFCALVLTL